MKTLLACTTLSLSMLLATSVNAAVPDQSYTPSSVTQRTGADGFRQSFIAGITGQLTGVDLRIAVVDGGDRDVMVSIFDDHKTRLGGISIAPGVLHTEGSTFVPFDLAAADIRVQAGNTYFLGVDFGFGAINTINWDGTIEDGYANGALYSEFDGTYYAAGGDLGFKTYVNAVPVPAGIYGFVSGLVLLATHARSSRNA